MIPELAPGMNVSATGLQAEQMRLRLAAHNLANVNSTRDIDGGPYKKRMAVFSAILDDMDAGPDGLRGVKVAEIIKDNNPAVSKYMPWHPDADEKGFVKLPDISPMMEMLDIMTATRAYEANLNAMKASKTMFEGTVDLIKV